MSTHRPFIAPTQYDDPVAAFEQVQLIYDTNIAHLRDAMYLGQNEQLQLRLSGGQDSGGSASDWRMIKAAVANPAGEPPPVGRALTLACAPVDVVVLAQ